MTIKDRHMLDFYWVKLAELCGATPRPVTAGEFAAHLGIAKNTARKYLERMRKENAVHRFILYRGSVPVYRYIPANASPEVPEILTHLELSK